jgi:hypothetical protein
MGYNDTLSVNGDYTITNLKAATGIADDRLSAHHPNGAGNKTGLGDFAIKVVGYEDPQNPGTFTRLLRPVSVNGSSTDADGSYDSQDPPFYDFSSVTLDPRVPDTVTLRLYTQTTAEAFGLEQILKNGTALAESVNGNATLQSTTVDTSGPHIDLTYEITGFTNAQIGLTYDDPLNVNAGNQGKSNSDGEGNTLPEDAGLVFRTQDVLDPIPKINYMQVAIESDGGSVETIYFDFNLDSNDQDIGEGNVVYDPAGKIDAQFYLYSQDPSSNSSFANATTPGFNADNQFQLRRSSFSSGPNGNREIQYFMEIQDQSSTVKDVVSITINEGDTGTWGTTKQIHAYRTPEDRNTGDRSSPYSMNYDGQVV